MMQKPFEQGLVAGIVLLNAYCFGANCVERFVNYQTWKFIPSNAFQAYHRAQQPLIQAFVVAPLGVGFVLQLWLALRAPPGIDPLVVWVMAAASVAGAVSTALFQLPIHAAFHRSGYSPEFMRKLLRTDWIRKAADAVRLAVTVELLHQLLSAH
jgi:hypothetical protein